MRAAPSLPIFVVGMAKRGTTSLAAYFECGGLRVSHNFCGRSRFCGDCVRENAERNRSLLDGCGNFDVYTQLDHPDPGVCFFPQIELLRELSAEHPHATLLLNVRPVQHWIRSVDKWGDLRQRLIACNITGLPGGVGGSDADMAQFYHDQVLRVYDHIRQHSTHPFVFVDIESPYASHTLEQAFGYSRACWTLANKN